MAAEAYDVSENLNLNLVSEMHYWKSF